MKGREFILGVIKGMGPADAIKFVRYHIELQRGKIDRLKEEIKEAEEFIEFLMDVIEEKKGMIEEGGKEDGN